MKWPLVWRSTHEREVSRLKYELLVLRAVTAPRDPSGRFIKRGEG